MAIGVDNEPSTFFRPKRSSANIYLNCLMYTIINKGFQNWNYLVLNMLAWLEGRPIVKEF